MNIWQKIKKNFSNEPQSKFRADFEESRKIFEYLERLSGIRIDKITDYNSYLDAVLGKIWASYRACDMVSNVVSSTRFQIVNQKGIPQKDKEMERILKHPNTHETFTELLYLTAMHIKLLGNAYWFKDSEKLDGSLTQLIPLYPQYVKVHPDKKKKIGKYEYTRNGNVVFYRPDQIIHFKRPNPKDPILGIGDIEANLQLFNDYLNQSEIKTKGLERGNVPAGVLVREEYEGDEAEWERAKASWEQKYISKGRGQGSVAWLTGKWNFLKLGLTPQETEQVETEKKTEKEIFLAHGVPASIAGFENAANYATARQDYINFTKFSCLPLVQLIFARLNDPDEFLAKRNPNFELEYNLDGLIDVEQMIRDYKPLVDSGGMTLNELRLKCGLKATDEPNHEIYLSGTHVVTLEDVISGANNASGELQEVPAPPEPPAPKEEPEGEVEEEDEKDLVAIYGQKMETVPHFVSANAKKGLELRKLAIEEISPKLIREARLLARGEADGEKVIRMAHWFVRHEVELETPKAKAYLKGKTDRPTTGQILWLLWGGDLGESNNGRVKNWATRQTERILAEQSGVKSVDVKSLKTRSWKFGSGSYDAQASKNAKRGLAYLETHKPEWSELKIFKDMYSSQELRGMASVLSRKHNISYKSMAKIANASRKGLATIEKASNESYSNPDALLIDLLGGTPFMMWASEEVGEIN
jgi:HK97 family phage portal protein